MLRTGSIIAALAATTIWCGSALAQLPSADAFTGGYAVGVFEGGTADDYVIAVASGGLDTAAHGDVPWGSMVIYGLRCVDGRLVIRTVQTEDVTYEETGILESARLSAASSLEGTELRFSVCDEATWDDLVEEVDLGAIAAPASVTFTGVGEPEPYSIEAGDVFRPCPFAEGIFGVWRYALGDVTLGEAAGLDTSMLQAEGGSLGKQTGARVEACSAPARGGRDGVMAAIARYEARATR